MHGIFTRKDHRTVGPKERKIRRGYTKGILKAKYEKYKIIAAKCQKRLTIIEDELAATTQELKRKNNEEETVYRFRDLKSIGRSFGALLGGRTKANSHSVTTSGATQKIRTGMGPIRTISGYQVILAFCEKVSNRTSDREKSCE